MTLSATSAGKGMWTRDNIIEKIQRWNALYGEPPRSADWNPSAAKWSAATWRIDRYRAGDPETGEAWPSLNAAKRLFDGSLNKAVMAAGFEPNKPGPASTRRVRANPELLDHVEMAPTARAALVAAEADARKLKKTVETRERQLDRARDQNDRMSGELDNLKRRAASAERRAQTAEARVERAEREAFDQRAGVAARERPVKTVTKTVKVGDPKAVERVKAKLAKVETEHNEVKDALRRAQKVLRDRTKADMKVAGELDELNETIATLKAERDAALDRAAVAERAPAQIVEVQSATDADVAEARKTAHQAELRAEKAERQMREQGAAVTGEARKLTASEIAELRKGGASGSGILAGEFKKLAVARSNGSKVDVRAALTGVASAAIRWREAL